MTKNQLQVPTFLDSIGVSPIQNKQQFWQNIKDNHGTAIHDQLFRIMTDRTDEKTTSSIYEAKNQTLKLSTDFAGLTADYTSQFLQWLLNHKELFRSPKKILEIGSDNGIVTCFIAMLYPEAEVVGVEVSRNGNIVARELAEKLHLNNLTFIESNFLDIKNQRGFADFDLILSLKTMHEILTPQNITKSFSTFDFINELHVFTDPALLAIHQLLNDENSHFITCERLALTDSYAYYAELLKNAHLYIDWTSASFNHSSEMNHEESYPIFITSKKESNLSTFDGLVMLAKNSIQEDTLYGILAEQALQNMKDKVFQGGIQINWINSSNILRLECWVNKELAYFYKTDLQSFRQITSFPVHQLDDILYDMEVYVLDHASPNLAEILDYETIQERNELQF